MPDTSSVERAFAILETFERERRPLSLKEIAEVCRIPASTCHSLVHTLLKRAYLYQSGRRKDFYPTRRIYDLGAAILANDPVLQRLLPAMQDLREATREAVILGKRQGDRVVYLEVLESPEVIRYSAQPGDAKPFHSTCIGKALLSVLSAADVAEFLARNPPARVTENTITTLEGLLADLNAGRAAGCFVTQGENVPDVTAVAVPLWLNNEHYGLAIAGPAHRMNKNLRHFATTLMATGERLAEQAIAA